MHKKLLFFVCTLCLATGFAHADDQGIARAYVEKAGELFSAGAYGPAFELANRSFEYWPDFSEAHFLAARILFAQSSPVRLVEDRLVRALKAASWVNTPAVLAQKMMASILHRSRRHAEAVGFALAVRAAHGMDPAIALILARSYAALGNPVAAREWFETALALFPKVRECYTAYAGFLYSLPDPAALAVIMEKGLREFKDLHEFSFYAFLVQSDPVKKAKIADDYVKAGGMDPRMALEALALSPENPKIWIDAFVKFMGHREMDLLQRLYLFLAAFPDLLEYARGKIGALSGEYTVDADRDGIPEERYTFTNGLISGFRRDADQDNVDEEEVRFEKDIPVRAVVRGPIHVGNPRYSSTVFSFDYYPWVSSVTYMPHDDLPGALTYAVIPRRLSFPLFTDPPSSGARVVRPVLIEPLGVPDQTRVAQSSFGSSETGSRAGESVRMWELEFGVPVLFKEDLDGDGQVDHVVVYEAGLPVMGMRDMEADGFFELRDAYQGGVVVRTDYISGPGRVPEYSETGPGLRDKQWDMDGDGTYDARETFLADGSSVLEFSTHMNGIFDLTVIRKDGRIIDIRRERN